MKHMHTFPTLEGPLAAASTYAMRYRESKTNLHATAGVDELRQAFDGETPIHGQPGDEVIAELISAAEPGLVGCTQPGFHAWVMGSSNLTGVAADWLTAIWGQNAGIYQCSPAAATAEEVACNWLLEILDLPRESSVGVTTGATMAGFIGLAAARDEVLRREGYNFTDTGLQHAPPVTVFLCEASHASNHAALRYLGFGRENIVEIPADEQGRMLVVDLTRRLSRCTGPKIIIATAGQINSGSFDDFEALADLAERHSAWLHVDAAFGLWARSCVKTRAMTNGIERADSWSTDGHKWLQVPFDAGFAIIRHRGAHRRAMDITASYLPDDPGDGRNATHFNPELSRRARGFAIWAVLKEMGKNGISDLVCNHCDCASLLGYKLAQVPGIEVVNNVVLNQVMLRFGESDSATHAMTEAINADGTHFLKTATWRGQCVLRVSVIGESVQPADIRRLAAKISKLWNGMRQA